MRIAVGEVVRIDGSAATVKPFDGRISVGIGTTAFQLGAMRLNPDASWKVVE